MRGIILLSVLGAGGLTAASLNNGERDRAMSHLHASRKVFLDATANLSAARWSFKAGPDRWSIAEIAEHLALTEGFLFGYVAKLVQGPPEEKKNSKTDEEVLKLVASRETKVQAPEPLKPVRKWANPQDALAHFKAARDKTIAYVEKTPDDLRHHFLSAGSDIKDTYQVILLLAAHVERHTAQIAEVKADPKYPRK